MPFPFSIQKIAAVLRASTPIAGLEISDSALHFLSLKNNIPRFLSMRFPPGLMEANRIKNRPVLEELLKKFRLQVLGAEASKNKKVSVVVSLSSISIYSQVFGLPIIQGENLEKAVQLNIQMVSPVEVKEAYSGWQLVGEDKDTFRLEVLSAFIDRNVVDEITNALQEAGFMVVAIESRALALARLVRQRGARIDLSKSYIVVHLDSSGMDFLILRKGHLYFEYAHSWKDIQDEKQQVTKEAFEALLKRSLYQVLNFYGAHWPEPIRNVVVSATALGDEVVKTIASNFGLEVQMLTLDEGQMTPEWFVALGSALRGLMPRGEDRDISLLGVGAQEGFRREQFLEFINFWRVVFPVVLGIFLITFLSADIFLINLRRSLESQGAFQIKSKELAEIASLQAQAVQFNKTVSLIQAADQLRIPRGPLVEKLSSLFEARSIQLNRLSYQDGSLPVRVSGQASTEDAILDLKKEMDRDPALSNIELPLTGIKKEGDGYSFSLSFSLKS